MTIDNYKAICTDYPEILTLNELCRLLRVGRTTAGRILKRGEIEYFRTGTTYRIPLISVIEYMAS